VRAAAGEAVSERSSKAGSGSESNSVTKLTSRT
jgi:hypothetical protein